MESRCAIYSPTMLESSKQTLAGSLPNPFFGHVILAFEELVAYYFERDTKN